MSDNATFSTVWMFFVQWRDVGIWIIRTGGFCISMLLTIQLATEHCLLLLLIFLCSYGLKKNDRRAVRGE
jgi:hypothetical protein